MRVNLEGYILYNTAMNSLLLLGSGRLAGLRFGGWRVGVAALFGSAYAVLSGLSSFLFLQEWYCKLVCAALMTGIAFAPNRPRSLMKVAACFFLAAFLLGGTGFSAMYLLGARGFGWGIAAVMAVGGTTACVALAVAARAARYGKVLRNVVLRVGGEEVCFVALADTGNRLTEPISGLPVMIAQRSVFNDAPLPRGLPVAYASLAGGGALEAFEPDEVFVDGVAVRMMVAAHDGPLCGDGRYAALLPWTCAAAAEERRQLPC